MLGVKCTFQSYTDCKRGGRQIIVHYFSKIRFLFEKSKKIFNCVSFGVEMVLVLVATMLMAMIMLWFW